MHYYHYYRIGGNAHNMASILVLFAMVGSTKNTLSASLLYEVIIVGATHEHPQ